jgi:hypothetical protein
LTSEERAELHRRSHAFPPEGRPVPLHRQARVLLRSWRQAPPPGFLIYGQGRSGSTLLGELLGSHPQVCFADEVLRGRVH